MRAKMGNGAWLPDFIPANQAPFFLATFKETEHE
jgi:hypothetical protein